MGTGKRGEQPRRRWRQAWVRASSTRVASEYRTDTTTDVTTIRLASAAAGPTSPAWSRCMMATEARMVSGVYRKIAADRLAMETTKK